MTTDPHPELERTPSPAPDESEPTPADVIAVASDSPPPALAGSDSVSPSAESPEPTPPERPLEQPTPSPTSPNEMGVASDRPPPALTEPDALATLAPSLPTPQPTPAHEVAAASDSPPPQPDPDAPPSPDAPSPEQPQVPFPPIPGPDPMPAPPNEPAVVAEQSPPPIPAAPPQPVPVVPPAPQSHDLSRIAQDLQIRKAQVEAVVQLLDEGNTVPFITRYRKERTGGLNEDAIRRIQERVHLLRQLADRKQTILKSIANQGKLTDALAAAILAADHPKRLEDLYLPFKPKKRTLASDARDKGLEPLALAIWNRDPAVEKLDEVLPGMVDPWKQLHDTNDVLTGVRHILAELISELAEVRGPLRMFLWDTALLVSQKVETVPEGKGQEYRDYFDFKEPVRQIPPHRVLAVNRGEKEQIIRVRLDVDRGRAVDIALSNLNLGDHPHRDLLIAVVAEALDRLVLPSLEREIRRDLTDRAQDRAIHIFAQNLRSLLLQPPLRGRRVLAIDPGLRTGCKVAALDETGALLEEAVIHPHPPQKKVAEAKLKLEQLIRKHQTPVIAIGNGTACRETEQLVSDLIAELEHRRLNPQPTVTDAPPVTSETPSVPTETGMVESSDSPPPVVDTVVSAPVLSVPLDGIEPPVVTSMPVQGEATVVSAPVAQADEVSISAPAEAAPPPPPAAPPAPVISLDGLPDAPADLAYVIVNEAGASDYSASPIAKEEFPNLDATARGTVSIGRRLQDPLAELVKIDPQHVGVGLYQHDVRPKHLKESLQSVIESCVNHVGVDLNTASVPLLRHVSGLNQLVARELVEYRKSHGPFRTREQLLNVPNFGEKRFIQAAGFLKIRDGDDPLDMTWVHPESYPLARQILSDLGFTSADLRDRAKVEELREKLKTVNPEEVASRLQAGVPTVRDIFDALARPGRDPREDLPPPIFKKGILKLEDLKPGMELKGTVLNVVDFGAFVDVGLKDSGLVHISQMANRYIKSPYDVVAVGDVVTVWVINVDANRRRVSLTMIPPGSERRPPERRPFAERPPHEQHAAPPPRGPGFAPRGERPPQQQPAGPPRQFGGAPRGPGQRFGHRPPPPRPPAPAGTPTGTEATPPTAAPAPPPPPRKPQRPKPLPNLTAEKKTGKAPLNTFAELAALFKTKSEPPPPPAEEKPAEEPPPPPAQ
jgi:uncharacterized protein